MLHTFRARSRPLAAAAILILAPLHTLAAPERHYQEKHCDGVTEHVLHDRTRVDCLTADGKHAVEYEFGSNWAESPGQSLGYAFETGRRAGIVLILEDKQDYKYWLKLNSIIDHYGLPIDTWKIEVWDQ